MKKIISICLVLCMLLGMVSAVTVSAALTWPGAYNGLTDEYKNGYVSTVGDYVAAFRKSGADGTAEAGVDYQASSSSPWAASGGFTQIVGDWAYLEVDMPYTGVYVMQMHNAWLGGSSAIYHVTTEDGYAAEFNITTAGWSSGCYQDQPMYLKAGVNVIKVALVGGGNATIDGLDFGAMNATSVEKSLDYLPNVKLAEDLVEPTPAPTAEPTPTPTPKVYYPEGWDGVAENHPDYNADAEVLYIDYYNPNMSSDEGTELFGTDWGMTDIDDSIPNKGQANAIYLAPGAYATYTVTVTNEGVYGAQVKASSAEGATILQMQNTVNGVNYYSQHNIPNRGTWVTTWSNSTGFQADDLIYLQAGANEITIKNVGSYGATYENNDFGIIENSMQYLGNVGTDDNPAGTDPEGWNGMVDEFTGSTGYEGSITALSYNSFGYVVPYTENGIDLDGAWVNYTVTAPQAGMYLVYADAVGGGTVTLTTEALDYVTFDFADFIPQYIYLEEGDNVITATGNTEFVSATFYQLNNSDNYLDQNKNVNDVPEEASDIILNVYADRTNSDGFYRYGAYDAVVQYSGSSMTYDVNCFFPGIYRVQAKIGGTPANGPIVTVDTDGDEGYRAQLATSYTDDFGVWRQYDADGNFVYVYLKEGINKVSVTAGGTHHVLWGLEFKLLSAEEEATITMDDLTKTPPADLVIEPYEDTITTTKDVDYHMIPDRVANDMPYIGSSIGTELVPGEWQRFEVTAKTAGYYRVSTTAATYNGDTTLVVETANNISTTVHAMSPDNYRTFEGDVLYLNEGVNFIWVQNRDGGFVFLKKITLSYVTDMTGVAVRTFVQGHNYIGAPANPADIEKYTVRNNYYGLHMGDTTNAVVDTETKTYNVSIPNSDYYGLLMTATMPLVGNVKVTMNNGVDDIVVFDGVSPYFGNENEVNTLTLTTDKVYLEAGDYTMSFTYTEHSDAVGESKLLTHVHGFEFTTLTRQDMLLAAMQQAADTADIASILDEYADVLADDIGADVDNDFVYPEYAYSALLNCAMLENGSYETYDDVKTAYDFAKNMISSAASDDGSGLTYTVQVGDWNETATVLVAVYAGDKLYMMGEGYLDATESTGVYVPVEATLYDYDPQDGDVIKVFIWDSVDGLKPIF